MMYKETRKLEADFDIVNFTLDVDQDSVKFTISEIDEYNDDCELWTISLSKNEVKTLYDMLHSILQDKS